MATVRPGEIIDGKYKLMGQGPLGRGMAGEVWKARLLEKISLKYDADKNTLPIDTIVALKLYYDWVLKDERHLHHLEREFLRIAPLWKKKRYKGDPRLGHLVRPYDQKIRLGGRHSYMVAEYVEGVTLHKWLDCRKQLDPTDVFDAFYALVSGLSVIHEGAKAIHRDIKPENAFVLWSNGKPPAVQPGKVKLGDFGILTEDRLKETFIEHNLSFRWASPEQLTGSTITKASDMYSLGLVLYFLIYAKEPWSDGERPEDNFPRFLEYRRSHPLTWPLSETDDPWLRKRLIQLGKRLTGNEKIDRFQSAMELNAELENLRLRLDHRKVLREDSSKSCRILEDGGEYRLFDERRYLDLCNRAPTWAFDILSVFPYKDETIHITHEKANYLWSYRYILSVDLKDQDHGIWNNAGKTWLKKKYIEPDEKSMSDASKRIHTFLMQPRVPNKARALSWRRWAIPGTAGTPLRWSSAGILPFAHWRGRWWVVLFFRDIPPVGLNVGNGASENLSDWTNLGNLIVREFAEEFIVVSGKGETLQQFALIDHGGNQAEALKAFGTYVAKYRELRKADRVSLLEPVESQAVELARIRTPFEVVICGGTSIRNVMFSINPDEQGIEVVAPYKLWLRDDQWLLDGEINPSRRAANARLLRRPVVMISVNYLMKAWKKSSEQSLGKYISHERNPMRGDGKELDEPIRGKDFKVWVDDKREDENWVNVYKEIFKPIVDEDDNHDDHKRKIIRDKRLLTLCPVTWKTLEMAFRHGILREPSIV